jgi:hypothetical protein
MNLFSLITATSFLFSSFFSTRDFQQEVTQADMQLNQFIVDHYVAAAALVYSDDFVLTTSSEAVKKKQDMLNDIGLTDLQFEINTTADVQVRVLGNTAVLTGTLHQKGLYKQKPFDNKLLVTDTWVLVDGRWKLLAGHATIIKPTSNN